MNKWVRRSLETAILTAGFVAVGAGAAHAADAHDGAADAAVAKGGQQVTPPSASPAKGTVTGVVSEATRVLLPATNADDLYVAKGAHHTKETSDAKDTVEKTGGQVVKSVKETADKGKGCDATDTVTKPAERVIGVAKVPTALPAPKEAKPAPTTAAPDLSHVTDLVDVPDLAGGSVLPTTLPAAPTTLPAETPRTLPAVDGATDTAPTVRTAEKRSGLLGTVSNLTENTVGGLTSGGQDALPAGDTDRAAAPAERHALGDVGRGLGGAVKGLGVTVDDTVGGLTSGGHDASPAGHNRRAAGDGNSLGGIVGGLGDTVGEVGGGLGDTVGGITGGGGDNGGGGGDNGGGNPGGGDNGGGNPGGGDNGGGNSGGGNSGGGNSGGGSDNGGGTSGGSGSTGGGSDETGGVSDSGSYSGGGTEEEPQVEAPKGAPETGGGPAGGVDPNAMLAGGLLIGAAAAIELARRRRQHQS